MRLSWIHAACPVGPRHVHHRDDNFGKCIAVNKGGFFHNRKLDYLFPLIGDGASSGTSPPYCFRIVSTPSSILSKLGTVLLVLLC